MVPKCKPRTVTKVKKKKKGDGGGGGGRLKLNTMENYQSTKVDRNTGIKNQWKYKQPESH